MSDTHSIASNGSGSQAVASALRDNVDDIARSLEPLLFPDGIPEDFDIPVLLRALADVLERGTEGGDVWDPGVDGDRIQSRASGRMMEAAAETDPEASDAMADEVPACGAGDPCEEARQALRHMLLRVRSLLGTVCGPQAPRCYKLEGRIPEEPEALLVFSRRAARALEKAEPGAGRPAPFVSVDLAGAAACLRDHIDSLDMLLHAPDSDAHPHERASRRWSRRQQTVTSIAEALLRLADERAAAKPALRHPRSSGTRRDAAQPAAERPAV